MQGVLRYSLFLFTTNIQQLKTEFNNRPHKRQVQEILFREVKDAHEATVLLGPHPEEYIKLLREYITATRYTIHGYDFEPTINSRKNLKVHCDDIIWAEPTTFIDLDLCATITTSKYLMFSMFQKQRNMNRESLKATTKEKVFMVTLCRRANKRDKYHTTDVLNAIGEMLNRKIDCVQVKTDFGTEFKLRRKPRGYDVKILSYTDTGAHMITAMIKYN